MVCKVGTYLIAQEEHRMTLEGLLDDGFRAVSDLHATHCNLLLHEVLLGQLKVFERLELHLVECSVIAKKFISLHHLELLLITFMFVTDQEYLLEVEGCSIPISQSLLTGVPHNRAHVLRLGDVV